MKQNALRGVGVFLVFLMCVCAVPAFADRYIETDDGFLIDTETNVVWEKAGVESSTAPAAVLPFKATWRGTWTSRYGESGNLTVRMNQVGRKLSGNMDVTNTDCGNLTRAPFSGKVNANGMISVTANFNCGATVQLRYTRGRLVGRVVTGTYTVLVNGSNYDSGTFRLQKK